MVLMRISPRSRIHPVAVSFRKQSTFCCCSRIGQAPVFRGASAFRYLVANFATKGHISVYYRDENWQYQQSSICGMELLIEPRYPMFGGWRTAFYHWIWLAALGLFIRCGDYYESCALTFDLVLWLQELLCPEGSSGLYLPRSPTWILDGRPVVVLKKINVVPEHNQYFQVYYRFQQTINAEGATDVNFRIFSSSLLLALFTCEQTHQSPSLLLLILAKTAVGRGSGGDSARFRIS
ncbi:hypothetical protein V6N11_014346 [Hibiscus sabdariffa]|uniref:Dolichyl-diphosphooligosaccharide--protein glycosyltransferase subunit 1 n=1 Tax=Hibiscus sabdariffa TaxID=183260 RepID=A0ABR2A9H5_9ROSI